MIPSIELRTLAPSELDELVRWAGGEGWNPGPADAQAFHAADPEGYLGCFVDGQLAAGISAVRYDDHFGFIGLYISKPDYRGKGYGLRVWNAGMDRLTNVTVGLDGVPEQQANYAKMGFVKAYGTARWSGRPMQEVAPSVEVTPYQPDMLAQIEAFDARFFPAPRKNFLAAWLSAPRHAFVVRAQGKLRGYAVARQCLDGYKIGPLFAEDETVARDVFLACASACADGELHLDVPEEQIGFASFLKGLGFARGFETARMYRGPAPQIEQKCVFAITTLELG